VTVASTGAGVSPGVRRIVVENEGDLVSSAGLSGDGKPCVGRGISYGSAGKAPNSL
jgi:hypothetical protein